VMFLWGYPVVYFGGWDVDWSPVLVALALFGVAWIGFVSFCIRRRKPQLDHGHAS
jgi:hypothetical protein